MHPSQIATALAEVWTRLAVLLPGGRVDQVPGGLLVSTDAPDPSLRGPLIPLDGAGPHTIDAARELTRRQQRALAVDHIGGVGDLDGVLTSEHFEKVAERVVMSATASIGIGDERARLATDDDVAAMIDLEMEAFGMTHAAASAMIRPGWSGHGSIRSVIDGDAGVISMATVHPTKSAIGVFGVATSQSARNQGCASSVVAHAVAAAVRGDESRPAWLHCEPHLEPVYRSMGFDPVGSSTVWVEGYL